MSVRSLETPPDTKAAPAGMIDEGTMRLIHSLIELGPNHGDQAYRILEACFSWRVRIVAAVMWIGRNDFDTYADALAHAAGDSPENLAGYVSEKSPLADYLTRGLERLGAEGLNQRQEAR